MLFRLRYLAHDLELPMGDFCIGRSADCQLSLDDPLVSRRHALLKVRKDGVTVEDLGSRNGVLVNGTKIDSPRELESGDKIGIGSQEMALHKLDALELGVTKRGDDEYRRATQTLGAMYISAEVRAAVAEPPTVASDPGPGEVSKSIQSFRLLGGVADKALALGRAEEAERILQALLLDVLARGRAGKSVDPEAAEYSARYAARLAGATTKGLWVDYVFDLYTVLRRLLPAPVVDELYTVVRKVKTLDIRTLRTYLAELRKISSSFGPAERFLMQRIEGLERLGALK
jgi:hypothetical protein